ncbi:MAG: hypothetical protein MJA31_04695 [Clostridia bacterium]|nr:hypothetical protein [Clostridia bacterium]
MFIGESFIYDGKSSHEMYGLMVVQSSSSLVTQNFGTIRKTITEKIKNRSKNYFYGIEDNILTFTLELAKKFPWTYEERVAVTKWLFQDTYKVFKSEDYPLEYKCVAVDGEFKNTGFNQGFLKIKFECDASHPYSPSEICTFDLSNNTLDTIIELENKSNILEYYKPQIEISMKGSTGVKFENLTDGGRTFELTNLYDDEVIFIDNEREIVYSPLSDTRLSNLVDKRFLRLAYGINRIKVTGKSFIEVKSQYPMMM